MPKYISWQGWSIPQVKEKLIKLAKLVKSIEELIEDPQIPGPECYTEEQQILQGALASLYLMEQNNLTLLHTFEEELKAVNLKKKNK